MKRLIILAIIISFLFAACLAVYISCLSNNLYVNGMYGKDTIDIYCGGIFSTSKYGSDICLECNTTEEPFIVILRKIKKKRITFNKIYFLSEDGYAVINKKEKKCYIYYINEISENIYNNETYNYHYLHTISKVNQYVITYNSMKEFSKSDVKSINFLINS